MDIHKPKPVHGWQELLREIGIIVVGVLIALAAEGIVDSLRWDERTRETKEHLLAELHLIAVDAMTQETFRPCVIAMLHSLRTALVTSGDDWRPPFVATYHEGRWMVSPSQGQWEIPDGKAVLVAPTGRWEMQAWRNAQSDGTANHFSQEDGAAFGRMYELAGRMKAVSDQELLDIAALNALAFPQRLDPASRSEYLRLLGRVRSAITMSEASDSRILGRASALGLGNVSVREYGLETRIFETYCRQFHDGKKDLSFEFTRNDLRTPVQ
jgi:hypothetical protein